MKGTLITTTARGDLRPLAVQGIRVPDCHHQLTAIVRSRLGDAHALLFAEPVFDDEGDTVDWYTTAEGDAVLLSALDAAAQADLRTRLGRMAGEIRELVANLDAPGAAVGNLPHGRGVAGDVLIGALSYPDERCLYAVGVQPVVVCWGCGPATAGVEAQDLSRVGPVPAAPLPTAKPAPDAPCGSAPPGRGGCLPRTLALALLLLLLVLLALLLTGRLPALCTLLHDRGLPVPIPDLRAEQQEKGRLAALRADIERIRQDLIRRKALCGPLGPDGRMPSASGAPGRTDEQRLNVPAEASKTGDVSFLEGKWVCHSGLADSAGRPVAVMYTFDQKGQGAVFIWGSGEEAAPCHGRAQGSLNGDGLLTIETEPSLSCPGGRSFRGQTVECRNEGGHTRCRGRNVNSATAWEAVFAKQ